MGLFTQRKSRATRRAEAKALKVKAKTGSQARGQERSPADQV